MFPRIGFGVLYDFRNLPSSGLSLPELYERTLDQIKLVDALGYDHLWLTEHHFVDDGYLPSPLVVSGAIAAVTKRVAIGQNVMLVPFHNPVRLAEDLAVLDNLSNGVQTLFQQARYADSRVRTRTPSSGRAFPSEDVRTPACSRVPPAWTPRTG